MFGMCSAGYCLNEATSLGQAKKQALEIMKAASLYQSGISYLNRWSRSKGLELPFEIFRESLQPFSGLLEQGSLMAEPILMLLRDGAQVVPVGSKVPAVARCEEKHFTHDPLSAWQGLEREE
jgi:hypothetical protein